MMNFNFENEIILESTSLLLRPTTREDIDNLLPIALADQTMLQYSPKEVYTKELLTEYIETAIDLNSPKIG